VSSHPSSADAWWELYRLYDRHLRRRARAARLLEAFRARFPNDPRSRADGARPAPPPSGSGSSAAPPARAETHAAAAARPGSNGAA
jgi:hypothetical protein